VENAAMATDREPCVLVVEDEFLVRSWWKKF